MTTARTVAADALHFARKSFITDILDYRLDAANLSGADRRLAAALALGVTRRRGTLDALLTPFCKRPLSAVEPRVRDVLHLGAYQLAILTQIPPHAAVHETVDLARHVGSPMARGFVNGVLRRIAESVTDEFVDGVAADHLPLDDGRYRKLTAKLLPDPGRDPPGHLAAAFSWPRWLADRWHFRFGFDECVRLGFHFNAAPPLWIRVNKRATSRENYRLALAAQMIDAETGPHPQSLKVASTAVESLPGFAEGDFAVQDHASMQVAGAVNPQPGWRVLDLCAAPGGKATHLAELMDDRGQVLASDIDAERLKTVSELAKRLKLSCVETHLLGELPAGPFDAVLVDAPCSNTGVLGRRPDVRWRLRPGELDHLIQLQMNLLRAASDRVKPGGVLVYSTCSIEEDENDRRMQSLLGQLPNLKMEAEQWSRPGEPSDGGYWARLRKVR